jgi:class 3 adenylate cyclase
MVKVIKNSTKGVTFVESSEKEVIEFDLSEGMLRIYDFLNQKGLYLPVSPVTPEIEQSIDLKYVNNDFAIGQLQLNSGKVKFTFENDSDRRSALLFILFPAEILDHMDQDFTIVLDPYLDGKKLLTSQTFRDLFRHEVIQGNEGINVKDLTILFTDLKGSTELYDKVGDLKAFDLVNSHFESLSKVITNNSGAIVKTIGDAIMATFANPLDAIKAATGIVQDLKEFNQNHGGENIIIKIGVHKGSSIAVTLNDRLDYFGQTVNTAARVQGLADAEEIYITDSVYDIEEVQSEISGYTVVPERTKLKGIEEEVDVYKVLIESVGSSMAV